MKVGTGVRLALLLAASGLADGACAAVYDLVSEQSRILVLVYRAGPLGGMGHNHVVSVTRLEGAVDLRPEAVDRAEVWLRIPVQGMEVDDPQARAEAGDAFAGNPGMEAIRRTRSNMLGPKVLHAERYPAVEVQSLEVSGALPALQVQALIRVRDSSVAVEVPVRVQSQADGLRAQGSVRLAQSAFGIEPFKILFGAVAVRDEVQIRFDLYARRRAPEGAGRR